MKNARSSCNNNEVLVFFSFEPLKMNDLLAIIRNKLMNNFVCSYLVDVDEVGVEADEGEVVEDVTANNVEIFLGVFVFDFNVKLLVDLPCRVVPSLELEILPDCQYFAFVSWSLACMYDWTIMIIHILYALVILQVPYLDIGLRNGY